MITTLVASLALATPVVPHPAQPGAGIHQELVDFTVPFDFDADRYDALLEEAAGRAPVGATGVRLLGRGVDGVVRPLDAYLPVVPPMPDKEPWATGSRVKRAADNPGVATGFLSNRAVYVSQCHGWIWYDNLGRFATQRGQVWDTVEDFHNPEGADQFLTRYLENAGAGVFTVKERDINPTRVVVDDGDADYAESGAGFTDGPPGWGARATWPYAVNPFDEGGTRSFPADGGAVATWTPVVPEDGRYAVYVSWDSDAGNATDAHYRLTHPGGVIDRYYDQTQHGSTWQYVEELWLPAGSSLTIELIGDSASGNLSADAVRIGGGMGTVERSGELSGMPAWQEGAIQYTQYNGAPTSVYDPFGDGNGSDPTSRSKWADWEHPNGEDAVYLSWHSNAFDGTARGTITYFAGGGSDEPGSYPAQCGSDAITGSYSLARAVQDELMGVIRDAWDANWQDRNLGTACFSEVSPSNNDEMPAILVELAFHDNETDALHLKHPEFRRHASRAMYRGIVTYFAERDGLTPVFLPEPPVAPALTHDANGNLHLTWKAGPSGGFDGDPAETYRVYLSTDGRTWDNGTDVPTTECWIQSTHGQTVYARVVGVNAGGWSFPSEVVGARKSPEDFAPVLVIGAFDRIDRGLLEWEYAHSSLGDVVRMNLDRMNPLEITVAHGEAIRGAGWFFDSASDEAAADLDLGAYDAVVWATGEESTNDESVSDAQQAELRAYRDGGGALWVSGAEVLWDLDWLGSATDQAFAAEVLGAGMASDQAGSTDVDGVGPLAGVAMDFGVADGAPYPVEWPDTLSSSRDTIATYGSGEVAGVLGERVATFGFPFDAIADPANRVDAAAALLPALLPDITPPDAPDGGEPPVVLLDDPGPYEEIPGGDTGVPGGDTPTGASPRVPIPEPRSCGCDPVGGAPAGWAALGLLALVARRRR